MRIAAIASIFAAAVALGACGQTTEQQAATGGLAGLAVGGPVGAAVGAGVGAAAGDEIQATGEAAVQ